jgi:hypothetical protein
MIGRSSRVHRLPVRPSADDDESGVQRSKSWPTKLLFELKGLGSWTLKTRRHDESHHEPCLEMYNSVSVNASPVGQVIVVLLPIQCSVGEYFYSYSTYRSR